MVKKAFKPEQIIGRLREAEVLLSQGLTVGEASRKLGITEQTYYRWRREYGGMRVEQAKRLKELEKENNRLKKLVADITALATKYGRYGYRRITALLKERGWQVNHKRVERIWRQEGLKVPNKQPKRGRLWLNDGSCIRLRPEYKDHVWSYDFVTARTTAGRAFRMLPIIDEYTRECLAILVERRLTSEDVIDQLFNLFILREIPEHIHSDNGPEFTTKAVKKWLERLGVKTLFIEPGSPWRNEYNQVRPHSSLGYHPPAPEARIPVTLT